MKKVICPTTLKNYFNHNEEADLIAMLDHAMSKDKAVGVVGKRKNEEEEEEDMLEEFNLPNTVILLLQHVKDLTDQTNELKLRVQYLEAEH
jgi:hypothetical protein